MKKLFFLLAVAAMVLSGCGKIEESIDALSNRIDKLEQETIPTIDEQIAAINLSLDALEATDKELKGYIDGLQATADNLQEQINATNTKIDDVKVALQGEISTAKADVLAELETLETELKNELAEINATIETLKAKDAELDNKIADLKTYVDNKLKNTEDWVNATFATLEQYKALVSEVATIKEQIKAINQSITELETRLTTKINEDIANAVASLSADIQQKVKDITDAYTSAIKGAKEEITSAYTTAIQNAIAALDSALKTWVGEQLSGYYTIAEIDAKITALQNSIKDGDDALLAQLNLLKESLQTMKTEITEAYKKAIADAINTNNGVIDTKIANEIATVNQRITSEVATINAKITEIENRLNNIEAKLEDLLARIQSISYIPTYDDGKATVKFYEKTSQVTLDFEISPKDAVVELAKVWHSAVSVKAIYTQTRAVSFIDMPIVKFESDPANGVISVTASGENLSAEFFAGTQSASVRFSISDGNNSITSDYVPICATTIHGEDVIPQNHMIYYTTSDNTRLFPNTTEPTIFGSFLISNSYEEGQGILVFDAPITSIGGSAFEDCTSLRSITIPDSVTSIGNSAFRKCTSLTSISIPDSVTSISNYAFYSCTSLTSVTIPDSVTSIGSSAFSSCKSLTSVTIPDSVTSIGDDAFYNCTSLTSVTIPNSVTSIGEYAFSGCTGELIINCNICGYKSNDSVYGANIIDGYSPFYNSKFEKITIGNSVTSIGYRAFYNCKSLTSVTIHNSAPSISSKAFDGCTLLTDVYVHITDLVTYTTGNTMLRIGDNTHLLVNGVEITELHIPYGISSIGNSAFRKCTSLTSVSIPDSVTSIGDYAFRDCRSLTSITIPDSVTSIGISAFYYCDSLTSVTIPDSITSIGGYAFYDCTSLKEVYCEPITPPTGGSSMFDSNASERKIYVPRNSVDAYKSAEYWSEYADYIEGYDF